MSLLNYFSKDPNKRAHFIFNLIAPIYGKVDNVLAKTFKVSADIIHKEIDLNKKTVIDFGAGTGAWGRALKNAGAENVHGIDMAQRMLDQAKNSNPDISFEIGNIEDLKHIADNSFDIVTASFVMHGVKFDRRMKILCEMERISKKHIIINDFIGETPFSIRFLEFLERSDYKNFKKLFCDELKSKFINVRKIDSKYGSGVYLAEKNPPNSL